MTDQGTLADDALREHVRRRIEEMERIAHKYREIVRNDPKRDKRYDDDVA